MTALDWPHLDRTERLIEELERRPSLDPADQHWLGALRRQRERTKAFYEVGLTVRPTEGIEPAS